MRLDVSLRRRATAVIRWPARAASNHLAVQLDFAAGMRILLPDHAGNAYIPRR
jgi:hypothetical protein